MRPSRLLRSRQRRPVVEVAGVAGSGKSTLSRALSEMGGDVTLAATLRTTELRHVPAVLRGAPSAVAVVASSLRRGRRLSWVEIKLVLYLAGFGPSLSRSGTSGWLLVDQGPVYAMARLLAGGRPVASVAPGTRPWSRWLAAWAARLDMVVLLDAPTDVLLGRIDTRSQHHEVKGMEHHSAAAFAARYRDAYALVVDAMAVRGVAIRRVDTARHGPSEVRDVVESELQQYAITGVAW